jgi:hypothetical protein
MRPYYQTTDLRFTDKSVNANERETWANFFIEQIALYGQSIDYYSYNYQLSAHDPIYGEQPNAQYKDKVGIVMYVELSEQSLFLSKFGLQGDDDVTAWVPISSYYVSMSSTNDPRPEPKSGDVMILSEFGIDRPGTRGGKAFEITQRLDQEISTINPLLGHYVWLLKAKRLDYTFEPGLPAEKGSDQVTDGSFSGRLSGYTNPQTDTKIDSTNDVDTASKDIWSYPSDTDDVYGDYF